MTEHTKPKLPKWPFFLGDLLLLILAAWIVNRSPNPFAPLALGSLVACVMVGAWVSVTPFVVEYRALVKFAEADSLTTALEQIENLRGLTNQISFATAQWQIMQEKADKALTAAREVSERMTAEAHAFGEFMLKANDAEKDHLRLEVDKLRRSESEWLQTLVRMLDHIYAVYQAGLRSGQPVLQEQLGRFQNACRDAVRRLGLVPFEAQPEEPFDESHHQLLDPQAKPPAGAVVGETVATGFTYQGQLIRCAVVRLKLPEETAEPTNGEPEETAEPPAEELAEQPAEAPAEQPLAQAAVQAAEEDSEEPVEPIAAEPPAEAPAQQPLAQAAVPSADEDPEQLPGLASAQAADDFPQPSAQRPPDQQLLLGGHS